MDAWELKPARDLGMTPRERFRSLRRESGLLQTATHLAWSSAVRAYLTVGHRLEVHGQEKLPPKPPFVIMANHASHLDALVLASSLPWHLRDRLFSIAAGDTFFESPVSAAFAAGVINALPLWRRQFAGGALQELRQRLVNEPCAYIIFPEGTRCRDGHMGRFKPGLGILVAGTDVPVVPCHLHGTFEALPPNRTVPHFRKITVRIGEPVCFPSVENERSGWEEIAKTAEAAVRRLAGESPS
jgi:1-acyl-sn-glycerol-3-phosphate acyltransferase